jgi:hypothetical protein
MAHNTTNPLNTSNSDDQQSIDSHLSREAPPHVKDPKAYIEAKVKEIFED